jgi:hypothetical protein
MVHRRDRPSLTRADRHRQDARVVHAPGQDGEPAPPSPTPAPSWGVVVREWGRIGCLGFGGPPAHLRMLRDLCGLRPLVGLRRRRRVRRDAGPRLVLVLLGCGVVEAVARLRGRALPDRPVPAGRAAPAMGRLGRSAATGGGLAAFLPSFGIVLGLASRFDRLRRSPPQAFLAGAWRRPRGCRSATADLTVPFDRSCPPAGRAGQPIVMRTDRIHPSRESVLATAERPPRSSLPGGATRPIAVEL